MNSLLRNFAEMNSLLSQKKKMFPCYFQIEYFFHLQVRHQLTVLHTSCPREQNIGGFYNILKTIGGLR